MSQNPGITSKNIPVINCLRGVAALMICVYHLTGTTFSFGQYGVPMFFLISGVVIPLSMIRGGYRYGSWGNFMLKRLIRLEPPYLVCIVLTLIYFQVRKLAPTSLDLDLMPGTRDLILHVGYLVPFFHGKWALSIFWTLSVEFQYYIVLSLLMPLVLNGIKVWRYCFYMILLSCPFLLPDRAFFPVYGPLFLIGILYTFLQTKIIESRECIILMLLCITVSVMVMPLAYISTGLFTMLVIYFLPNQTNSVLMFFGKISYSLYLIHQITGKALINLLLHQFREWYQKPIVILAGFILATISAYVFYRMIEEPSQKLSRKIKYHPPEPS